MSLATATAPRGVGAAQDHGASAYQGTAALVRLAIRRDRVLLPVWALGLVALTVGTASTFQDLYPTVESRRPFAEGIAGNPGLLLVTGPTFDLLSIGGLTAWRVGSLGGLLVAIMSYLLVVRHTRAEEEDGRLELLGAGVVGRRAPVAAALAVAGLADAVIAVLVAGGLIGLGLPAAGSVALGLAFAGAGLLWAAVGAVTAQLAQTARAANGLAGAVLGVAFLLRGIGDSSGPGWLSWLSPLGWMQRVRPFAGERWWVYLLALGLAAVLAAAALRLTEERDLGAGVIGVRPGPAAGSLGGTPALAWRLHRAALLGWGAGMFAVGASLGAVAQGISSLLDTSPQLGEMFDVRGDSLVDSYLAFALGAAGVIAGGFTTQVALRLRTEETSGHAELLLSTPAGRVRWALGHVAVALGGAVLLLALTGLGAGVLHAVRSGDPGQVPRLVLAGVAQAPGAWVFAAIAVLLTGLLPRLTALTWAALVGAAFVTWFGPLLDLPAAVMDLSPYGHLPALPGAPVTAAPLLALAGVTAALVAAGLAGLDRRDLP